MTVALRMALAISLLGLLVWQAGCTPKNGARGGSGGASGGGTVAGGTSGSWGNATDINFTLFSGESKKLSDYAGKPVVLNFWAAW